MKPVCITLVHGNIPMEGRQEVPWHWSYVIFQQPIRRSVSLGHNQPTFVHTASYSWKTSIISMSAAGSPALARNIEILPSNGGTLQKRLGMSKSPASMVYTIQNSYDFHISIWYAISMLTPCMHSSWEFFPTIVKTSREWMLNLTMAMA